MSATITCPHCNAEAGQVYVEAPATVITSRRITAEIDIELDLTEKAYGGVKRSHPWGRPTVRYLVDPRLEDFGEVLDDQIDVHTLELDHVDHHGDSDVYAYCANCDGDLSDQFRLLLEERVPLERAEPVALELITTRARQLEPLERLAPGELDPRD